MTLAPHFVTSLSDFEVFGRETAGDVTVETSRITSASKTEIKRRDAMGLSFLVAGGYMKVGIKMGYSF